jgi:2,3,4,5-tetrahydropyridine-2-carboxylate N-succinyltransferase
MNIMAQFDALKESILGFAPLGAAELWEVAEARAVFEQFKQLLNDGLVRAAEKSGDEWVVNSWVKQGILLGMRLGKLQAGTVPLDGSENGFAFIDKDTYPLKKMTLENNVRIVPGGSAVRDGSYLAPSVVMMPPAYVNVGAYVDAGTMIDSHALVGSCAQIGKKVHLSAGVQVGGVLEPVGAMPVIIEDEVMVGGNCGIYEGTIVRERAVIGTGVILNGSTPVYDLALNTIYRKTADAPLVIPAGAVVVAGSRRLKGDFAAEHGLAIYTPMIIKYRDERTDSATALEEALR